MSITVVLTDELAERVERVAAERGVEPDVLARELIETQLPAAGPTRDRFAFVGMGHSGQPDLASEHKQIRRDAFAAQTADDV